ncbi:MAG: RidA family protein [Ignavibacteria bacterium]
MKEHVFTDKAPAPIGPYSQGVKVGSMYYFSGVIPLSTDGQSIIGGEIVEQTQQVIANSNALLQACGLTPNNVVKTTVFLKNMNDFAAMNAVYAEFFGESKPARSTVEVSRLPKDVLVEIEMIATAS